MTGPKHSLLLSLTLSLSLCLCVSLSVFSLLWLFQRRLRFNSVLPAGAALACMWRATWHLAKKRTLQIAFGRMFWLVVVLVFFLFHVLLFSPFSMLVVYFIASLPCVLPVPRATSLYVVVATWPMLRLLPVDCGLSTVGWTNILVTRTFMASFRRVCYPGPVLAGRAYPKLYSIRKP